MWPKFLTKLRIWVFLLTVTLGLSGCWAINDIIAPSVAEVGESVYMTRQLKPDFANIEERLTHHWNFGDGSTAEGNEVNHTYAQAGEYVVVLTATDTEGQTFDSQHVITVIPAASGPLNVAVLTPDNQLVSGAMVRINGQADRYTADDFPARFNSVATSRPVTITVEAAGYVSNSVLLDPLLVPGTTVRQAVVHLMPLAAPLQVEDIAQAQTLQSETLQAAVTIPESAFVDAEGQVVSGAANVSITPWDITNPLHMSSFPGDRRAYDDARQRLVRLISFGMMDVKVTDSNGQALQLAAGKTAQIQMDLPISTDQNGATLAVGNTIPLWHFNEAEGLWRQEGQGTVIASDTSTSGLAVTATVSHFSSWNWDVIEGGQSVAITRTIRCVSPDAAATVVKPCAINVTQTLPNGSVLTNQLEAQDGVVDFSSFVPTASLRLSAISVESLLRGSVDFALVSDTNSTLDVPMSEVLSMQNPLAGIPFMRLPRVEVRFALPSELLAEFATPDATYTNGITINQIKYRKDDEEFVADVNDYAALKNYADTWTGQDGVTYVQFMRLVSGKVGVPGALRDGNLNGNLTIEANAEYYAKGNEGVAVKKSIALVSNDISIDIINRQGPVLSEGITLERYTLWADFSTGTYAASAGDQVRFRKSSVTSDGVVLGTYPLELTSVASDHSMHLNVGECEEFGKLISFDIEVISAKDGVVTNYKTRPVPVFGSCY